MNDSQNPSPTASVADDEHFDPAAAAELLGRTRRDARRSFEQRTPLISLLSAVVVLAIYGTLWLSVRDQHPYVGPSGTVVAWVYGLVGLSAAISVTAYRRRIQGVHGRSRREDAVAALVVGFPWAAVYVFNGALHADGFGSDLVYGVFDAAGPWLVVGTGIAALGAGREKWGETAGGLCMVAIATSAAFAGPSGSWGVLGVAGFIGLVAVAVIQYVRLQRA